MVGKIQPGLGEVQETLLIPLYGRARDATARRSILNDRRARELVDSLAYDFDRFQRGALYGSVVRTAIFDSWVRQFLDEHPHGTVVEIGTGLNTRFERVDNGAVRWFDLDLADTIDLRRRYFADNARRTMIADSVLATEWFDIVAGAPGPYLFVAEAVLLYLPEGQVRRAIGNLAGRFAGSLLALDTAGKAMVDNQERDRSMKTVSARMNWACDDPRRLDAWGLVLRDSRTLATPQPEIAKVLPAHYRYGMKVLARVRPSMVNKYRFNLFRIGDTP
jgi:O-methyltransferase involved in polyketide biosynthesis